ncbi:MAG: hypothetical protein L6461_01325 [Anaerolineae bacterium]|nr:hypothetical protein [Anaerolineae bacterium]
MSQSKLIRDILTNPKFSFVFLVGYILFALTGCVSVPTPTITPFPMTTNTQNIAFPTITQTLTAIPTKIRPTLTPTPTLYPIGNGKLIAFNSEIIDETQYDVEEGFISVVNVNSHVVTRLTSNGIIARRVAWSPDGRYIAYNVPTDQGSEMLYTMNANGTNQKFIYECSDPIWSPDGNSIACTSYSHSTWYRISIINLNSMKTKTVAKGTWGGVFWSPDSQKIVYESSQSWSNVSNIFVQNITGNENPIQLTNAQSHNYGAEWSPDGNFILFSSDRTGTTQVYIMNADGSHEYALTNGDKPNFGAKWSPDGTKIIFVSLRHEHDLSKCPYFQNPCNSEIYIMNADGSKQTRLTNSPGEDSEPVWSPDEKYIAFMSYRDEPNFKKCEINCNSEIYVMDIEGKNIARLTNNQTHDFLPGWQPKP